MSTSSNVYYKNILDEYTKSNQVTVRELTEELTIKAKDAERGRKGGGEKNDRQEFLMSHNMELVK